MAKPLDFFIKKKPWSKYKDLILDYYLQPYLQKVKRLRKPILVVDCFAGPGKFDDGEFGSPLIIAERLRSLHDANYEVTGFFIESDKVLYDRLQINTSNLDIPTVTRFGSFRDHIPEITSLASKHTVFVYLDPIRPTHLHFNDLKSVYSQLMSGQSIETLINFMSTGFLRAVWGQKATQDNKGIFNKNHPRVLYWNQIAGGDYWQDIALDNSKSQKERTDKLAKGYGDQLNRWFKYILTCPIREKYEREFPKYHLVFGTRWPEAIDLMNRAMVKARREFVGSEFIEGRLFENQPTEEIIDPLEIQRVVVENALGQGKLTWKILRVQATIAFPSKFTDSEFNRAIKQAIKTGKLLSDCPGNKIEEDALIWAQQ